MEWWVYLLIGYFTFGFVYAFNNITKRGLIGAKGPLYSLLGQMLLWPFFYFGDYQRLQGIKGGVVRIFDCEELVGAMVI